MQHNESSNSTSAAGAEGAGGVSAGGGGGGGGSGSATASANASSTTNGPNPTTSAAATAGAAAATAATAGTAAGTSGGEKEKSSRSTKPKKPKKRTKDAAAASSKAEGGTAGAAGASTAAADGGAAAGASTTTAARKKPRKTTSRSRPNNNSTASGGNNANANSQHIYNHQAEGLSAAQQAVQEQMRRALEEDQYSAVGSILDIESEEEDHTLYNYRGIAVRLDKAALQQAVRKNNLLERLSGLSSALPLSASGSGAAGGVGGAAGVGGSGAAGMDDDDDDEDDDDDGRKEDAAATTTAASSSGGRRNAANKKKRKNRKDEVSQLQEDGKNNSTSNSGGALAPVTKDPLLLDGIADDDIDRDGGSIFGATSGSNNSTWVECDKCKKWRRLRGAVDEKKLPKKWYCSMNTNDPDRARCSAPEEEYDSQPTPESAADARTRKHMRVWIRRLQCNEAYEARQPTLTRGKKRAVSSSSKDPYEWIRCCNPSCGKWRSVLRMMDAKSNVVDRTVDGEWYCVMNNWDEKTASCAAPQENLPAVGCPPWVMQDDR